MRELFIAHNSFRFSTFYFKITTYDKFIYRRSGKKRFFYFKMQHKPSILDVDETTFEKMVNALWGDNETPLVVTHVQYKGKTQPTDAKGYLMLTNGAIYIFKNKVFGGPAVRHHISPLQIITADHEKDRVTLFLRDHPSKLKSDKPNIPGLMLSKKELSVSEKKEDGKIKQPDDYFFITLKMNEKKMAVFIKLLFMSIDAMIYKCNTLYHPILRSSTVTIKQDSVLKVQNLLEKRAIMFSHFTFSAAKYLESAQYFSEKWKDKELFVISKGFHPGNFAVPYANALGCDFRLETVCFNNAHFKEIDQFIDSLLVSSIFINQIAFTNYPRDNQIDISLENAAKSVIKSWTFMSCPLSFFEDFVAKAVQAKYAPKKITFGKTALEANGISRFSTALGKFPELASLRFAAVRCPSSSNILGDIISKAAKLQEIELNRTGIDGSTILTILTENASKLRSIRITGEKFISEISNMTLPEEIELLDCSNSQFIGETLRDLLNQVVAKKTKKSIILKLSHLRISDGDYTRLRDLAITENDNIKEFDFSGNTLSPSYSESLFRFLKSQHLSYLSLRDITVNEFLRVLNHMNARKGHNDKSVLNQIEGLEISGEFDPQSYIALLDRVILDAHNLKFLKVVATKSGRAFKPEESKTIVTIVEDILETRPLIESLQIEGLDFIFNDRERDAFKKRWGAALNKRKADQETIDDHIKFLANDILGIPNIKKVVPKENVKRVFEEEEDFEEEILEKEAPEPTHHEDEELDEPESNEEESNDEMSNFDDDNYEEEDDDDDDESESSNDASSSDVDIDFND